MNITNQLESIVNKPMLEGITEKSDVKQLSASFAVWLDKVIHLKQCNLSDMKALTAYTRGIFELQAANSTNSKRIEFQNSVNTAIKDRQANLEAIARLNFGERVKNGSLAIGTLENMAHAISTVDTSKASGKDQSLAEQRDTLNGIALRVLSQHPEDPSKYTDTLKTEVEKQHALFTTEHLETLQKETANEITLSKATEAVTTQVGAYALVLAGPEAIIDKKHPMHDLALQFTIQSKLPVSAIDTKTLEGHCQAATKKLAEFWKDPSTLKLLADHGVKPDEQNGLNLGSLDEAGKHSLAFAMTEYINKFPDEEKAALKELSKRSAAVQQSSLDIASVLKGLFSGKSLSTLLSSGAMGLLAGKMLSPMFGLVVTVISFLLNNSKEVNPETKPRPPQLEAVKS